MTISTDSSTHSISKPHSPTTTTTKMTTSTVPSSFSSSLLQRTPSSTPPISNTTSIPYTLFPTVTVQPDWHELIPLVLQNKPDLSSTSSSSSSTFSSTSSFSFWLSLYFHSITSSSLHASILVQYNPLLEDTPGHVELKSTEPELHLILLDKLRMICQYPTPPKSVGQDIFKFSILAPFLNWKAPTLKKFPAPIYAIDINAQGTLLAGASEDGRVFLWNTADGQLEKTLEGHLADVTQVRFFPSGQVLLSCSADMTVRIWSASDGSCPRVLQAHRGRVTDCGILARGKTVVTCSLDGTVKLWESATAKVLHEWNFEDPIHALTLLELHQLFPEKYPSDYTYNSEADRYLGVVACQSGSVIGFHLNSLLCISGSQETSTFSPIFQFDYPYRANTLCFLSPTHLAVGYEDGMLLIWNIVQSTLVYRAQVSGTPVLRLAPYGTTLLRSRFVLTTADGLVRIFECIFNSSSSSSSPCLVTWLYELSGNELDPLYGLTVQSELVMVAGRQGEIHMYRV